MSLLSHASCAKNLRVSIFEMTFASIRIFCSGGKYTHAKLSSRISKNTCSIFCPIPSRSTRGKFLCSANQY